MFNIIILGITSLLTDISSEMVYPILPIYLVSKLGASPAILGLIEGIAESLASLLKVFSGFFSDKFRLRKPFAILGYTASTIGKWVLFISTSWGFVLLARIIDRFGKGIRTAPRDALIADSVEPKKNGAAFGLHRAMDTFGACVGIILAYFIVVRHGNNFKDVFLLSLIPAFIGVVILFFAREKKHHEALEKKEKINFSWRSLDKRLKLFLIFSFIFTLGNSSNQFLLLRAQKQGASFGLVILFYLVFNIFYFLSSYPAGKLSDRIGRKKLLVAGYAFYAIVYFGFALNSSLNQFWLLFSLYGLYMGFTEGVEKALVSDIAPRQIRATAIGMHATLVGIGLFPASFIAGLLWQYFGAQATFFMGGFLGLIASIGLVFILKGL